MNTKCELFDGTFSISNVESHDEDIFNGHQTGERNIVVPVAVQVQKHSQTSYVRTKAHWSEVSIPTQKLPSHSQGSNFQATFSAESNEPSPSVHEHKVDDVLSARNGSRSEVGSNGVQYKNHQTMFQEYKLPQELENIKNSKNEKSGLGQRDSIEEDEDYYNPERTRNMELSQNVDTITPHLKKSNSVKVPESVSKVQEDCRPFLFGRKKIKPRDNVNSFTDLEYYDINSDQELNSMITRRRTKSLNNYEEEFVSSVESASKSIDDISFTKENSSAAFQGREYRTPEMRSLQSTRFDKRYREILGRGERTSSERDVQRNGYLGEKECNSGGGRGKWDEEIDGVRKDYFIKKSSSVYHNDERMEYEDTSDDYMKRKIGPVDKIDYDTTCVQNYQNEKQHFSRRQFRDDRNDEYIFGKTTTTWNEKYISNHIYEIQNTEGYTSSGTFHNPIGVKDKTMNKLLHIDDSMSNGKDSKNLFELPSPSQESQRRQSVYPTDSGLFITDSHDEEDDTLNGIQSKDEFKKTLKQLSRYVLASYKEKVKKSAKIVTLERSETSGMMKGLYHLDEEEGELAEIKEDAEEFKRLSMVVNVISHLREMYRVIPSVTSSSLGVSKHPGKRVGFDDDKGNKLLRVALESGRINEVKNIMLNHLHIDVNVRGQSGFSCLHKAAEEGDIECLRILIEHNANVDISDRSGFPPVHHALQRYHYKAAMFLMDCGTDLMSYTSKRIQQFLKVKATSKQYLRQNLKTLL